MNFSGLDTMRKLAWIYCVMFVFIVAIGYVPAFKDENGLMFGLFSLELHDDILHLASGIWAAWAAWRSRWASVFYFRLFGVLYGLDGVMGLFTGHGYLDGGIILHPGDYVDPLTRLFANLPHILIGGIAVWIGFVLANKYRDATSA